MWNVRLIAFLYPSIKQTPHGHVVVGAGHRRPTPIEMSLCGIPLRKALIGEIRETFSGDFLGLVGRHLIVSGATMDTTMWII